MGSPFSSQANGANIAAEDGGRISAAVTEQAFGVRDGDNMSVGAEPDSINPEFTKSANEDDKNSDDEETKDKDPVTALIKRYKKRDILHTLANLKTFQWQIVQVPMLFFYITAVAQAGEITVKCRGISSKFSNPNTVSLFVFFEIEVFAFFGIILGLWLWLTGKYFQNAIYHNGPQYTFKTKGIKSAADTLVRNHIDVFIFTGFFWDLTINAYLLSDLNASSDIIGDSSKTMIR